MLVDPYRFIRRNTVIAAPPLVPEIRLHLATEITPIWQATEESLARNTLPPPFWAFAWAGGQALARYVLDHPAEVAGRSVLDFGSGSGLVAIAAAKVGASSVVAAEIDDFAAAAIAANAALNEVTIDINTNDLLDTVDARREVVTAGDVCYERPMADRVTGWLRSMAAGGALVLLGDPGRAYLPGESLLECARYVVPTSRELEDYEYRETVVWEVLPRSGPARRKRSASFVWKPVSEDLLHCVMSRFEPFPDRIGGLAMLPEVVGRELCGSPDLL
jgi:predicted nicotinamide N-methyase